MIADRLDLLLERALAEGAIPVDASAAERAELERLLAASDTLLAARASIQAEVEIALPVARARFERFLAAEAPRSAGAASPPLHWRRRLAAWLGGGFLGVPRFAAVAGPVAAVMLFAVILAIRGSFGAVETAVALESGDYVQFEGTVAGVRPAGEDLEVDVRSGAGRFLVLIPPAAVLKDAGGEELPATNLKAGAVVLVDGLVEAGKVHATTMVLGEHRPAAPAKLTRLAELRGTVSGTVLLVRLAKSGTRGEVVVLTDDGQRVIVPVSGGSVEDLLHRFATALGERIEVRSVSGGVFRLETAGGGDGQQAPTPRAGRPALIASRGLVMSLSGERLQIRTLDSVVDVAITSQTRFLAERSGLAPAEVRDGRAVLGHTVAVTGHRDPRAGILIADLVIVGPRPLQAPR